MNAPSALAAWPDKPVRIIVAVAAGGPTDDLARLLAGGLTAVIGGSFVVKSRGGGGHNGIGAVALSDPDGCTLLVAASSLTISVAMPSATPYDPGKDLAPIALIATTPTAFAISANLGVNDLKSLMTGAVQMLAAPVPAIPSQIDAGNFKALAVTARSAGATSPGNRACRQIAGAALPFHSVSPTNNSSSEIGFAR